MKNDRKKQLDELLVHYSAQPFGDGHIDIIARPDNYKSLLKKLIELGYEIFCISWWE